VNGTARRDRPLVLGVGSPLWGDDGIGVRLVEQLDGPWDCYDGGTGGLGLLTVIEDYGTVIILDAVDGGFEPGTVFDVDPERVPRAPRLSCHQMDLADLLAWRSAAGIRSRIHIVGIQPERIALGEGLGPLLTRQFEKIRDHVRRRIERIVAETDVVTSFKEGPSC